MQTDTNLKEIAEVKLTSAVYRAVADTLDTATFEGFILIDGEPQYDRPPHNKGGDIVSLLRQGKARLVVVEC